MSGKPSNFTRDLTYALSMLAGVAIGGDVGGTLPGGMVVTAIQGVPVADLSGASDGDVLTYVAASADLELLPLPVSGIEVRELDAAPDVAGVLVIRVPNGSLTDNGGGDVSLGYATTATSIDQFAGAAGDVDLNGHNIVDLADPSTSQDAATKAYVDSVAGGGSSISAAIAAAAKTYAYLNFR